MDILLEFVVRTVWYLVSIFLYTRVSFKMADCTVKTSVHLILTLIVSMILAGWDVYIIFYKKE